MKKTEVLSKFFSSVCTHEPPGEMNIAEIGFPSKISGDLEIIEENVKEQLQLLDTSKSPEPDKIHSKLQFELRQFLAEILTKILNKSWEESKLAEDWKLAHKASIFKNGKKSLAGNYRTVSLTSIVCKLFEKSIRVH